MKQKIIRLLRKRILILDGATGTELQKRGMPAGVCPEVWCMQNPGAIQDIHVAYRSAGSDIVYTCSFGANRAKMIQYGFKDVGKINKKLAALARRAVGNKTFVAGNIGPTGRFVEPFGDLRFEEAVSIFKEQVRGLLDGGVDLFAIETMMDIQEARAALIAVREITDHFTVVTMTYETDGRTLNGTDPVTALITLQSLGADAVGCNCSTGPNTMVNFIYAMKPYATVPLVAKPNAGMPKLVGKETVFDVKSGDFASFGKQLAQAGANLIGGCCGTTPEHIKSLKDEISNAPVIFPVRKSLSAVSSARGFRVFDRSSPVAIVGERINPTGKKALQQDLREGRMSVVRQIAKEQEIQGADLLDVNVGVHGIDETDTITKVIHLLSTTTSLPLVIDSPNTKTVEVALRTYPGRALLNSISGEKAKMKKLLPVAAKYGSMFILLPVTDTEVPESARGRKTIVRNVFQAAKKFGFSKEDVIVDGLVMTVASKPQAVLEALKTVAWCTDRFRCRTILGLSNVSFGMPERKWMNVAFMSMAQASGLTMAIANPAERELMNVKVAGDVFMQKDRDASLYIQRFSEMRAEDSPGTPQEKVSPERKVFGAILEGDRDDIVTMVEAAVASGKNPSWLVNKVMIPAIIQVGELFDKRKYFLPQLIASAEAMKAALGHLDPYLRSSGDVRKGKGVIILATVKGDIHDIGKNIVALMLRNHGYEITDLGKDVPARVIVEAIKDVDPVVVGLSALMTTTMENMRGVIDLARASGYGCPFIVGGAAVTRSYARSIGAVYAKDGVDAVRLIDRLLRSAKKFRNQETRRYR